MIETGDPLADAKLAEYDAELQALIERAHGGELNKRELRDELERVAVAMILLLFLLSGGDPDSAGGARYLSSMRRVHKSSARKLATDVFNRRYLPDDASDPAQIKARAAALTARIALWVKTGLSAVTQGRIYQRSRVGVDEPRYTWRLGATEQHCKDCLRLNGVTLTASEWARIGIQPQSPQLECGGWNCDCRLELTDAPSDGMTALDDGG